jgi:replication-associated recombination protein RarA
LQQSVIDIPAWLLSVNFTGRQEQLDLISKLFNTAQGDIPSSCAIYGMPGIGKTQLMLRFAVWSLDQQQYTHVFWMSGTTVDKLYQGFTKILDLVGHHAQYLTDQGAKLTAARLWLEAEAQPWLLIVDNVHRDAVGFLQEHLPRKNRKGNVLFTTRTEDVAEVLVDAGRDSRCRMVHLQALELQDTANLLLKDAGIDTSTAMPVTLRQAEELVERVGRLPLAVVQAASFMKRTHTTLDKMGEMYKGEGKIDVSQYFMMHYHIFRINYSRTTVGDQMGEQPDSIRGTISCGNIH